MVHRPMAPSTESEEPLTVDPEVPDLDGVTDYEDGDHLVICDRENPRAWIRSQDVWTLEN